MFPKKECIWRQSHLVIRPLHRNITVGDGCGVSLTLPVSFFIEKNDLQTFSSRSIPHLCLVSSHSFHLSPQTVAGAILSGYGVLILGAVIKSKIGGKAPEPEPAAPAAAPAASSGDLPSIESPEFETFIESADDAAIMKWVESASD